MSSDTYPLRDFTHASPAEIEDTLERGEVVFFERPPIDLPADPDLEFLRNELPVQTRAKNVSYHPESDSIPRFEAGEEARRRVQGILRTHGERVAAFWQVSIPGFVRGSVTGTTSFRPAEEKGRNLKPRSSNELVHVDAGAYGATNGGRILRFFVNVHPTRERVWGTKGSFESLMRKHALLWEAARDGKNRVPLEKRALDRMYSAIVRTAGRAYPLFRVIDSSPYDRSMRRIHNCMKENPVFLDDRSDFREIRFPPMSAWMVFTDGISHSVLTGQHALVTTALVPLENCRSYERTPYAILEAGAEAKRPSAHQ